jgi:hypothetical protein
MSLTKDLEILIVAVLAFYAAAAFVRWPRFGMACWICVTCFLPAWLIVRIGVSWPPAGIFAALLLPTMILRSPRIGWRRGDLVVLAIVLLCFVAFWQGGTPQSLMNQLVVRGVLAYIVARHLAPLAGLQWTINTFVGVLLVCAVWSAVEYAFEWHAFENFDIGSPEGFWAAIQYRGGHARSEAAFGHAIALGGSLAMATPFILASTWRTSRKFIGVGLVGVGVLATASRGPMLAVLLGVVLMILLYQGPTLSPRQRRRLAILSLAGGAVIYVVLIARLTAAGTEATASAAYRGRLYSYVLSDVHPISLANNVTFTQSQQSYRFFGSVDSTFIYEALFYGWFPVAVFMLALLALIGRAMRLRAGPASIALIAQIPVLATVAPITQYASLLWFLGGLVVVEGVVARRVRAPGTQPVVTGLIPIGAPRFRQRSIPMPDQP